MLIGLDWKEARERLDTLAIAPAGRARVIDMLGAIEAGAMTASAAARAEREEQR